VSRDEANRLATNGLVLEELRKRKVDVIPLPFDGPIGCGGSLRCAHHPLLRKSVLA
jgi:N-dimethylarginine dimethylaminohydrolase